MKTATKERVAAMMAAALAISECRGWATLTHEAVARQIGVSPSLVKVRFGSADALRRAVMRAAVRERRVGVVAQGLAVANRDARRADEALRGECADWMLQA